MSLLPYNAELDNEVYNYNLGVMRLYVMFLKKEGLFSGVYTNNPRIPPLRQLPKRFCISISGLSNQYTHRVMGKENSAGLVHSQLWRGFVLDNIDSLPFINNEQRKSVINCLKNDLRMNGTRRDERVREILRKYDIKIIETRNE